jgi:hypothetical protein
LLSYLLMVELQQSFDTIGKRTDRKLSMLNFV